jgi:hypothetical protein
MGEAAIAAGSLFFPSNRDNLTNMSANDIVAELPKLSREELEQVDSRLHELLDSSSTKTVWENLLEIAGTAKGLPDDYASEHDHYIHGTPKK